MAKILVADDSAMMLQVAKMTLEKAGYTVVAAADGAEAVAKSLSDKPDLVMLDAEMPEMDGWEAAESIAKNPATAGIPVLICTGHDLSEELDQLKKVGARGFITKPYQAAQLLDKVKSILQ